MEDISIDSKKILEYIGEGIFYADTEGRILFLNKAAENLTGWKAKECIGRKIEDIFKLKNISTGFYIDEYYYEILKTGLESGLLRDTVLIKKDMSTIFISAKISPVKNELNEITGIVIVFRDITRLRNIENKLSLEHRNLKTIFEKTPVGMFVVDKEFNIVDLNYCMLKILERRNKEPIIGKKLGEGLFCVNSIPLNACGKSDKCVDCEIKGRLTNVIQNAKGCSNIEIRYEIMIKGKPNLKWLKIDITTLYLDGMKRYLLAVDDITRQKILINELEKAKEEAEAANKAKSQFLANMSHEIRTPLNGMLGMIDLTLMDELNSTQKDNLETAKACADSLLKIINDILDFSKIEAGKMEIVKSSFNLADLIEKTVAPYKIKARDNDLTVDSLISSDLPEYIITDPVRLKQVLSNLLSNALKFTCCGSIRVTADVETIDDDQFILFEVSDTGLGIAEDELGKLFISFSQVDGSYTRKYSGTGLGLAISKQLTEKMGGKIGVRSEKGKGSTFYFTIKLEKGDLHDVDELNHGTWLRTSKKLNILLVEDDRLNRTVIGKMLNKFGYNVVTADNGIEAIKAISKKRFDVVLMDIQMPDMDGVTATQYIRNKEAGLRAGKCDDVEWASLNKQRLPIVALTAYAIKGDKEKFLSCGMDAYVAKPIIMSELFHTIETLVKESEDEELSRIIELELNGRSKKSPEMNRSIDINYLGGLIFKINNALQEGNASLVEKYSHMIKEYSEKFGEEEIWEYAFKIELNARKNKFDGVEDYIRRIEKRIV